MNRSHITLLLLIAGLLSACEQQRARTTFKEQLEICDRAEASGVPTVAVTACGAALDAAVEFRLADADITTLTLRIGRIERQLGNFVESEAMLQRSMSMVEQAGDKNAVACRQVQLAVTVAGQKRWTDAAVRLLLAGPSMESFSAADRDQALRALHVTAQRLEREGDSLRSEALRATARTLRESPLGSFVCEPSW